ncbi:MAG: pimeloyl-ACP methyl ester carboxylesterase [Bacteroidia bacterium]|jgi:pimeloyl-ACP methyl ester carboxylesterase
MKRLFTIFYVLQAIVVLGQDDANPTVIDNLYGCDLNNPSTISIESITLVSDTNDNYFTDTCTYPPDSIQSYPKLNKAEFDTRLIYFVHGLGGNDKSWDAVDDAHTSEYLYTPLRVDYEEHQRDFDEASYEVYLEMNKLRLSALYSADRVLSTDKPYAIGHSQGGLVLRDMDRKYNLNYDAHFQENLRQFYGIVTFCTPHLGANIATSQIPLSKLSADFANLMGNAALKNQVAKFSLKVPFLSKRLLSLSSSASQLVESLSTGLVVDGINIMSKGQQAPMTQQYGPFADYVNNTMNYSNPNTPKALFYAEESDPILFRIATYMIGPAASDFVHYKRFEANDDKQIEKGVNELRAKLLADIISHQNEAEKIRKKINRTNIPIIGLAYLLTKKSKLNLLEIQEDAIKAETEAVAFIEKVNAMYKTIVGAVDVRRLFKREIVGYWCVKGKKEITVSIPFKGKQKILIDDKTRVDHPSLCDGINVIPIYGSPAVEQKTDAVITVNTQKGFPGCDSRYKLLLNEVRVYNDQGKLVSIKNQSDVNHIQILNCSQTDEALRRVYEGRGVPIFFKLKEKKQ